MPFLVPVQVKQSPLEGKGIFALTRIPKSTPIWICSGEITQPIIGHNARPNELFTQQKLETYEDIDDLKQILNSGLEIPELNSMLVFRDGSEYLNHSAEPNTEFVHGDKEGEGDHKNGEYYKRMHSYALRDIEEGEEITECYWGYCEFVLEWLKVLMEKYNPEAGEFDRKMVEEGRQAKGKVEEGEGKEGSGQEAKGSHE